jgi:hypothetical protein
VQHCKWRCGIVSCHRPAAASWWRRGDACTGGRRPQRGRTTRGGTCANDLIHTGRATTQHKCHVASYGQVVRRPAGHVSAARLPGAHGRVNGERAQDLLRLGGSYSTSITFTVQEGGAGHTRRRRRMGMSIDRWVDAYASCFPMSGLSPCTTSASERCVRRRCRRYRRRTYARNGTTRRPEDHLALAHRSRRCSFPFREPRGRWLDRPAAIEDFQKWDSWRLHFVQTSNCMLVQEHVGNESCVRE